jgi:serine/threonine-protein kinase HipA
MKALNYAGIETPKFWLSKSKKLFVMEKFTYQKKQNNFYGFEEFCALFGFNKEKKYSGSYERIAKAIYQISTNRQKDLVIFFKMLVMNYMLKNGDAHLKNFGMLYEADMQTRFLAPAYDVVNTVVYLPRDKPALTLFGKKVWWDKEHLVRFGIEYCFLNEVEALHHFNMCIEAVETIIKEIVLYKEKSRNFTLFGEKFIKVLNFSLETMDEVHKELPSGVL